MSQQAGWAIDHIGAYLDDGSIDTNSQCGTVHTQYTPQVYATSIITDSIHWTKIQGSFVATGTEKYITIGNFFDTAHTNKIPMVFNTISNYEIDDVSVIATGTPAYAGADTTVRAGDTAWIGVHDGNGDGMPCYWYVLGGTTAIDSSGTIGVHPADTTTYVVSMDLCGVVTYDTVTVNVAHCSTVTASYTDTGNIVHGYSYTGSTYAMDSVHWDYGDGTTGSGMNPVHTYTAAGTYHVCATMYGICGPVTSCRDITVLNVSVLPLATVRSDVQVYPNPVKGQMTVAGAGGCDLVITDMAGREVYRSHTAADRTTIDISHLQAGIYLVQITDPRTGVRIVKRVVKE